MALKQDEKAEVDISDRLREILNAKRLTVAELAARVGVSKSAMEKYLAGPSSPRAGTIIAICNEFGVTADWLLFPGMGEEYFAFRGIVSRVIEGLVEDMRRDPQIANLWLGADDTTRKRDVELWTRCDELAITAYLRFAEWRLEHRSSYVVMGTPMPLSPASKVAEATVKR